ncbi:MAG: PRTRC system ThiF family protein [Salinisphaeraceae bacterium]
MSSGAASIDCLSVPDRWLDSPIRVCVIGAGGTGGEVLDQLCRLHMTLCALDHPGGLQVACFDGDDVSASNIGRQRFGRSDIGQNKAVTLVNRINLFYGLTWSAVPFHWSKDEMASSCDLLITAVDSAAVRQEIAAHHGGQCLWLDFGNGASSGQAILGELGKRVGRIPHVIDLFPDMADDPNDGPSCSVAEAIRSQGFGVNAALVTSAMGSLLWPLLRKGKLTIHGLFMDLDRGHINSLPVDPAQWALFGYEPAEPSSEAPLPW